MNNVIVPVNYLAVFGAAAASMVIGFLWYGPLFGKQWMKAMGTNKQKIAKMNSGGGMAYGMMFVGSIVMSYVLAHAQIFAASYLNMSGISAGLMSGFFNWIGFVAPVTLSSVLWEGKSKSLWMINNGYYLLTLSVIGVILALWK